MNVTIRPATFNDVTAILDIVNYSILHTTANYNYDIQTIEVQNKWFEDKQLHHFPVIVAESNGQVIGYGTYGTFREKIGYQYTVEHSVYVDEKHTGKGIGKLLLQELMKNKNRMSSLQILVIGKKKRCLIHLIRL